MTVYIEKAKINLREKLSELELPNHGKINVDSDGNVVLRGDLALTGALSSGTSLDVEGKATISSNASNTLDLYKYGSNSPTITLFAANGTKSSPSQILTGDVIGGLNMFTYGTSGWAGGPSIRIRGIATENQGTTSSRGADLTIETVATGGVTVQERVRITNAGNVGIGTSSPGAGLEVKGGNGNNFRLNNDGSTYTEMVFQNNGVSKANLQLVGNDFNIVASQAGAMRLYTSNTQRVTIRASGFVGIGTDSPASALDVAGTVTADRLTVAGTGDFTSPQNTDGQIRISNSTARAAANKYGIRFADSSFETNASIYAEQGGAGNNASDLVFGVSSGAGGIALTSATERMRIDVSGNVGIGTASPNSLLHIEQGIPASGVAARIRNSDSTSASTYAQLRLETGLNSASISAYSGSGGAGYLVFGNEAAEAMRINSSGNLLVGTTGFNTTAKLVVAGSGSAAVGALVRGDLGGGDTSGVTGLYLGDAGSGVVSLARDKKTVNTADIVIYGEYGYNTQDERIRASRTYTSFRNNGSEVMRLASGNLGIGTSSPNSLLEISKANASGIGAELVLKNNATGVNTEVALYLDASSAASKVRSASIRSRQKSSGTETDLGFFTANGDTPIERVTVTPSGNVGIGTTSPAAKFEVKETLEGVVYPIRVSNTSGTLGSGSGISFVYDGPANGGAGVEGARIWTTRDVTPYHAGSLHFATRQINTGNIVEAMTIDVDQNVGIGTTTPAQKLEVVGRMIVDSSGIASIPAQFTTSSSSSTLSFVDTGTVANQVRIGSSSGSLIAIAGGGERMRIDASGFMMLARTSASTATADPGHVFAPDGYNITNIAGTTSATHTFFQRNGASTVGSITSTTGGVIYSTTSDGRLKANIQPIANATGKLMAMKPVTHTWIADPQAKAVVGFIAQEMQEIVPEAVTGNPDGEEMMSMDYGRITPVIVAALQDALKRIEALTARIETLEAVITA
jgi:hypothetical protein